MLTIILIISFANLALRFLACWQRHVSIREQRCARASAGSGLGNLGPPFFESSLTSLSKTNAGNKGGP
jgi:hypothetical protein